jgi:hypothetical protein
MAYDSAVFVNTEGQAIARAPGDFRRDERLVVLMGGAALGLLAGIAAAMTLGRVGVWPIIAGAPLFAFALYLSVATVRDALERRAFGCAAAGGMVVTSMLAWPVAALFFPMSALMFWTAPLAALGSMALVASCWSGAQSAVYRVCGQAAVVCAAGAYLGLTQIMG